MLDGFARHGLFDLEVVCQGDLDVDCHHSIEDTGIVLGTAIREAVGDKKGDQAVWARYAADGRGACIVCIGSVRQAVFGIRRAVFRQSVRRYGYTDGKGIFMRSAMRQA